MYFLIVCSTTNLHREWRAAWMFHKKSNLKFELTFEYIKWTELYCVWIYSIKQSEWMFHNAGFEVSQITEENMQLVHTVYITFTVYCTFWSCTHIVSLYQSNIAWTHWKQYWSSVLLIWLFLTCNYNSDH